MARSGSRRLSAGRPLGRCGRYVSETASEEFQTQQVLPFFIDVQEISKSVISETKEIPAELMGGGLQGGIVCTGFIDIEKIIKKVEPPDESGRRTVKVWFIEKKLPFQTLLLRLPDQVVDGDDDLCLIFFPRSAGFYGQNFFRPGTLTDPERSCAIACVEATSPYMAALLTSPLQDSTPGCPPIPVEGCELVMLGQECQERIEALLTPTTVGDIVADVCGQTVQAPSGQMTRQYFANLLNLCLCAQGAQGPVGGVDLNDTVNLNRLSEPTRSDAIAIFGTSTPTV